MRERVRQEPAATTHRQPLLGFAHRGGAGLKDEQNSLKAFRAALEAGAPGLETDIDLTADGVPVLRHIGPAIRGPRIGQLERHQLPPGIPTLEELYRECGSDFDLALDMAAPRAFHAVVATARRFHAVHRLWLTYWRLETLAAWRREEPDLHLVYPTLPFYPRRVHRTIERLAAIDADAINLHHLALTRASIDTAHTHGLRVLAWGIRSGRGAQRAVRRGVDGIFCDDVAGMIAALHER